MNPPITPESKIGDLLDAYPGLDESLAQWVPEFKKLKNPLLRRTVARVATVEMAAKIGGVQVRDLIQKIREAAGLETASEVQAIDAAQRPPEPAPSWFDPARIRETVDADAVLATGQHPLGRVRSHAAALAAGDIFRLISSFRPAPLIEALVHDGFASYCVQDEPGRYSTYFSRIR